MRTKLACASISLRAFWITSDGVPRLMKTMSAAFVSRKAQPAFEAERHLVAEAADHHLAGIAIADSRLDPSGHPALRRQHVQERQPGMVDGAGGLDELFGPGDGFVIVDPQAEQGRVGGDGGAATEIAPV